MLFYERIETKEETAQEASATPAASVTEKNGENMELDISEVETKKRTDCETEETVSEVTTEVASEDQIMTAVKKDKEEKVEKSSTTEKPDNECDIDDKVVDAASEGKKESKNNEVKVKEVVVKKDEKREANKNEKPEEKPEVAEKKQKLDPEVENEEHVIERSSSSGICKELEDWIWQDNKNFLQDVNIFEHTYFK